MAALEIEKHLRENLNVYFPSSKNPDKLFFIFVKSYRKNTVFVFDGKTKSPLCVVKVANEYTGERLRKYFFALKKIEDLNVSILRGTYPSVFFFGKVNSHEVLIESFIEGQRMTKSVRSAKYPFWKRSFLSNISLVNEWLRLFHGTTKRNERVFSKQDASESLRPIKDRFSGNTEIMKKISKLSEHLEGKLFFNISQHGDFHLDNILIKKNGHIAILDWDLFQEEGFPLWDLLDFLIYYCRLILTRWGKGGELSEYMHVAFFQHNHISRIVADSICKFLRNFKIDHSVTKLLFLLWLDKRFPGSQLLEYALARCEQFPFLLKFGDND